MAYIGQSIKNGTFSVLDTSGNTYNGSNTTFSLGTQVGSAAQLLVSHDGVIQKPGTDYTLASGGASITFTTAPASGASIFIVEISGAVGGPMNRDINGDELILDVDGDTSITADTDDQIDIKIGGTDILNITNSSSDAVITQAVQDKDILLKGNDGGSAITALTLDMSDAGAATLNNGLTLSDGNITFSGSGHGIHLGVTSATAANLLDDYEYGTWTPSLSNFSTSGTVTTVGRYVKAGRMVTAIGSMKAATSIAHDTSALVSGFPFAGPVTDFGTGSFAFNSSAGGNDSGILFCDMISSRVFFPSSMNTTSSNELCVFTVTYESAS